MPLPPASVQPLLRSRRPGWPGALLGLLLLLWGGAALAQSGNFGLELNSAQDHEGACRTTFVATNNTGVSLSEVAYEVVIWDGAGNIPDDGFLLFEFGQMPVAKTKVVQFDIPGRSCGDISRILINDQASCASDRGPVDLCIKNLLANSRSTLRFGK